MDKNLRHKSMHTFFIILLSIALFATTALWLSSYTHHTAIGIDHDYQKTEGVLHVFYRITWNGHGSLWVGYGSTWKNPNNTEKLEKFDPASVFFQSVDKPLGKVSFWRKIGFWYIHSTKPKPVFWIGVPAWLPVIFLIFLLWRIIRGINSSTCIPK